MRLLETPSQLGAALLFVEQMVAGGAASGPMPPAAYRRPILGGLEGRFSNRHMNDIDPMRMLLKQAEGKFLRWKTLTRPAPP